MVVRPAKTQISLGIRPVWSESSLSAWRNLGSLATHWAHCEDSGQTGRMPRLIWVIAGRTVTLLVLSWGGSFWKSFSMINRIGHEMYKTCLMLVSKSSYKATTCVRSSVYDNFVHQMIWGGRRSADFLIAEVRTVSRRSICVGSTASPSLLHVRKPNSTCRQSCVFLEIFGFQPTYLIEPRHEKTCLRGLRPGKTQTSLCSRRS